VVLLVGVGFARARPDDRGRRRAVAPGGARCL
jgi:hypothetical protein